MPADDRSELMRRAEDLFVARTLVAETPPGAERLTFANLVAYLTNPAANLSHHQQRLLFSDRRLRAEFQRLKAELGKYELPRAAAASAGAVSERRFASGTVRIVPTTGNDIYLVVVLDRAGDAPRMLLLEGADGSLTRLELAEPDHNGRMILPKSLSNVADAELVRLLGDPNTQGTFF